MVLKENSGDPQLADSDRVAIIEWAEATPEIAEVWLYGSRARGDNRDDDSDIDLAVVTVADTGSERLGEFMFGDKTWRGRLKLSRETHLYPYPEDDDESDVAQEIRRDGISIYKG